MNPNRLLMAVAAAALIALTTIPSSAAPRGPAAAHTVRPSDLGAVPAYPVADQARTPGRASRAASRSAKASRTGRQAREARKGVPEPRQAESTATAEWPRTLHADAPASNGSGVVRSAKTGATARVSPAVRAEFQAYVDDLERRGARVLFMGGYRKGACWTGGRHPCGLALDVCQLSRGRVDRRCGLPGPSEIASIAAAHGLLEGAVWGNSDYGHAQAPGSP